MKPVRLVLAVVLSVSLLLALTPTAALGDDPGARTVTTQGTTYAIDAWDAAGSGDGTPALATWITPADYGGVTTQNRTLSIVNGTSGDNDWVKFSVSADDVNLDATSYLIRTQSTMYNVDTVIEVYGPHPTASFTYTVGFDAGGGDSLAQAYNDEDAWAGTIVGRDSCLLFRPTLAGTYYVRIRPYSWTGTYQGDAGSYKLLIKKGLLQRAAGSDRIQTAIEVSKFMYEAAAAPASRNMAVVVANAYNFPDALAGNVLCGISDGVMLLTPPDHLPAAVGAEILRLGVNRVYVVGGESVVDDAVIAELQALNTGIGVYRVRGYDRYETAVEIALQAQSDDAGYAESISSLAIIAYGLNFPDALAASALSAGRNVPILLTGTASLNPDTQEGLSHLGTTDVVIVGGTSVVSTNVENQLKALLGSTHVYRIAGNSRYETAKEFAAWACDLKGPGARDNATVGTPASPTLVTRLSPSRIGIASGETFPDALSGGAACGLSVAPILLNQKSTPYGYITAEHDGWLPPGDSDWVTDFDIVFPSGTFGPGFVFGGTAAITQSTMTVLDNSLMLVNAW